MTNVVVSSSRGSKKKLAAYLIFYELSNFVCTMQNIVFGDSEADNRWNQSG